MVKFFCCQLRRLCHRYVANIPYRQQKAPGSFDSGAIPFPLIQCLFMVTVSQAFQL